MSEFMLFLMLLLMFNSTITFVHLLIHSTQSTYICNLGIPCWVPRLTQRRTKQNSALAEFTVYWGRYPFEQVTTLHSYKSFHGSMGSQSGEWFIMGECSSALKSKYLSWVWKMNSTSPRFSVEKVMLGAEAKVHWKEIKIVWCILETPGTLCGCSRRCIRRLGRAFANETRGSLPYPSGNREPTDCEGKAWLPVPFRKVPQQQCRTWAAGERSQKRRL